MEPEFDKIIDALLRSSPDDGGNGGASPVHFDAEEISAFAENAVPDAARQHYISHFADCGRCRGILADVIAMNAEAAPATAAAAVAAPVAAEAVEPWYRRLFRAPNLAFAMGALVLVFGGLIGYTVLQNAGGGAASIAQVEDSPATGSGPMAPDDTYYSANTANAAVNANRAATVANTAGNVYLITPTPPGGGGGGGTTNSAGRADGYSLDSERDLARSEPSAAAPAPAPPPAITMAEAPKEENKDDAKLAEKPAVAAEQQRQVQTQAMPPAANSGPVQSPPGRSTNDAALAKKRSTVPGAAPIPVREVGGKTFERREGVWYDREYSGQQTTNVRRGTEDYRKLDSGLRSITDNINGTVVVVWKAKAYRIQ